MKCLELLGVGKNSRSDLEAFCILSGISDCSGAVLADLGQKVMKVLFAGVIACYSKEADKYEYVDLLKTDF